MRRRRLIGVSMIPCLLALGFAGATALGAPPAGKMFGFTGSEQT